MNESLINSVLGYPGSTGFGAPGYPGSATPSGFTPAPSGPSGFGGPSGPSGRPGTAAGTGPGSFGRPGGVGGVGGIGGLGGVGGVGGTGPAGPGGQPDDGQYDGDYSAIPGEPGQDYPIYSEIPQTSFDCNQQQYPGYYADVEAQCQVFHICALNRTFDFLCPNGTIFSQENLVCVWWNQFDCSTAPSLYGNNANIYDYSQTGSPPGSGGQAPTGQGFGGQSPAGGTGFGGRPGAGPSGPATAPGFAGTGPSAPLAPSYPSKLNTKH